MNILYFYILITFCNCQLINIVKLAANEKVKDVFNNNILVSNANYGNNQGISYVQNYLTNTTIWSIKGSPNNNFKCEKLYNNFAICNNGTYTNIENIVNYNFITLKKSSSLNNANLFNNYLVVDKKVYDLNTNNILYNIYINNLQCNISDNFESIIFENRLLSYYLCKSNNLVYGAILVYNVSNGNLLYSILDLPINIKSFNIGGDIIKNKFYIVVVSYNLISKKDSILIYNAFDGSYLNKYHTHNIINVNNKLQIQLNDKYCIFIINNGKTYNTNFEIHGIYINNIQLAFKYNITSYIRRDNKYYTNINYFSISNNYLLLNTGTYINYDITNSIFNYVYIFSLPNIINNNNFNSFSL